MLGEVIYYAIFVAHESDRAVWDYGIDVSSAKGHGNMSWENNSFGIGVGQTTAP